ncbi:MAG: hypothetical protein ACP5JG_03545 [Anaerolineae bacterium]
MSKLEEPHFDLLDPKYDFVLNPYPDARLTKCPLCERRTGQRKLPLLIHVEPENLIALNYTCRYCKDCDTLFAHKDQVEHMLTEMFRRRNPDVIGNDYMIFGTVERKAWEEGMREPKPSYEVLAHTHMFKSYSELRMSQEGWFPKDTEPPTREPPPSDEWVKQKKKGR